MNLISQQQRHSKPTEALAPTLVPTLPLPRGPGDTSLAAASEKALLLEGSTLSNLTVTKCVVSSLPPPAGPPWGAAGAAASTQALETPEGDSPAGGDSNPFAAQEGVGSNPFVASSGPAPNPFGASASGIGGLGPAGSRVPRLDRKASVDHCVDLEAAREGSAGDATGRNPFAERAEENPFAEALPLALALTLTLTLSSTLSL